MSSDSAGVDLSHHLLIAMPGSEDGVFTRSVIYLCEHGPGGALGLVINKPGTLDLATLFEKVDLPLPHSEMSALAVLQGGPLQMDRGFVLHEPLSADATVPDLPLFASSRQLAPDVALTTSRDVLEALSCGGGPRRLCIALGCVGWQEGQLESELLENQWLTAKADAAILFDVPIEHRYAHALGLLGIDVGRLAVHAGHA